MAIPDDYKKSVLDELAKRKINPVCECCGQNNWAVLDHPVSVQITDLSGSFRIPPPQVPSAGLICNNCGNVRLFALGVLNLLPEQGAPA